MNCPRLIEVALPIREISAESVRQKRPPKGHLSKLHIWWARRPVAASVGIVFASLAPDPDNENCPEQFRTAVNHFLKEKVPAALKAFRQGKDWVQDPDPYRPYDGIRDTPRNRLLSFIAKWSPAKVAFDFGKRDAEPKLAEMLDERCLVKWEVSDPDNAQGREVLRVAGELIRAANSGRVPTVCDPFSGGGSIPLEASRLSCQAVASDYNPVAYLILKATCEFPHKFGKRFASDVEQWADQILSRAEEKIGSLYPAGRDGNKIVGYLWARTAPCSNPACRGHMPLLRSLIACDKLGKQVALSLKIKNREAQFGIVSGKDIRSLQGTMIKGGDCRCPFCLQITSVEDIRSAGSRDEMGEQMVAVIIDTPNGKGYRAVEESDKKAFDKACKVAAGLETPGEYIVPEINAPNAPKDSGAHRSISVDIYGFKTFGSLFNARQIVAMQTLVECFHECLNLVPKDDPEYRKALSLYLALWVSRCSQRMSRFGVYHTKLETIEHPFGRQSLAMSWDYPEANPFSGVTGSAKSSMNGVIDFLNRTTLGTTIPATVTVADAAKLPLQSHSVDAVVTDPPYFDSIAYADLSDFFYVWLKRSLAETFPEAFITPQTPKSEEAVAHKHRHHGKRDRGIQHFEDKLAAAFSEAKRVCKSDGIIAVMFAHQSTEAWTALINALLKAGLNITATYPIDTELTVALKGKIAALQSSITVTCRPRELGPAASFKDVRRDIEIVVKESVHRFWDYGFRGADLIVACYGPAVGVFGKHERVERADGSPVGVPELLELARQSALKAIAGEFQGDELSRLYFVWANQYGVTEQSFDDLVKVAQMGVEDEDAASIARQRGLFVVNGASCRVALLRDRIDRRHLGEETAAPLIDKLHHAMRLWKEEKRGELVEHLAHHDLMDEPPFWKLTQALFEVLPRGEEDWKIISALLGERETLKTEIRRVPQRELL